MAVEAAIRIEGLSKDFGSGRGVFGLDLEVRRGEIFGFLGPNGAGKSTTMRLLLGLLRPTAGRAELLGLDASRDGLAIRRRVGYLPGDFGLYPQLTGAAAIAYLARLGGGVAPGKIDALAERFDADLHRPVRELSTGNRQKLGLIQAVMHEPELLILDEPTVGVDPQSRNAIFDNLELLRERGKALLYTTHYMEEVERLADRIVVVDHGKVIADDTLDGLQGRVAGVGGGKATLESVFLTLTGRSLRD
jgi:ABC-2 type transport system ATP-binding protein